jgi:hypothetical protein
MGSALKHRHEPWWGLTRLANHIEYDWCAHAPSIQPKTASERRSRSMNLNAASNRQCLALVFPRSTPTVQIPFLDRSSQPQRVK